MLPRLIAALPIAPEGKTELTFYYPIAVGGPLTKVIDSLAAGFEKENPNVKVNAVYAGNYDDTRIKALAAHKAGQPAQLVGAVLDRHLRAARAGPDRAVRRHGDHRRRTRRGSKCFYPALMANGTYKGKVYGIPFQRSTIVLYWNKDAFKEAGLDPEKAPTNWDEMRRWRRSW